MSDNTDHPPHPEETDVVGIEDAIQNEGASPLLILFGITGIVGLVIALMLILGERPADFTIDDVVDMTTPEAPRLLNDWQADDFALLNLQGETVRLSDFAGRVVFINLWHTACEPCVREMPAFQQFTREQGDDGAVILAINQLGQTAEEITEFLERINVTDVTILLDPNFVIPDKFPYNFFPTTYVIDTEGMVRFFKIGEVDVLQMRQWVELVGG